MNYLSPNGALIVGTAESVLASALMSMIDPESGLPDYDGGTDVHWDTQETLERNGKILFVCEDGEQWTFDQLVPCDPDQEPDSDGP